MSDLLVAGGTVNAVLICEGSVIVAQRTEDMPPWKGTGTLSAPSSPYIVTHGGSPAGCILDLFDRATNIYIMSTTADPTTGAFAFTGLNTARTFDVRARGSGFSPVENDQIIANWTPA